MTVRVLLDLDEIRSGLPRTLSGEAGLDRPVRWVHVADSEGVGALLEGGELVLSTASGLRSSATRVRRFLEELAGADAAGALIELVDDQGSPDEAAIAILRDAVVGLDLPVVLLRRRIKFVRVTQAAHRLLIGEHLGRVERARQVHEVFTRLNLESADEQRIVDTTAGLLGRPVALQDVAQRLLLASAGADAEDLLPGPTGATGHRGGASVALGTGGRVWGRLVAPEVDPADAESVQVLERAGQALTLARMAARDQQDLLLRARAGFLQALVADHLSDDEARVRAAALGLPEARVQVPLVVHLGSGPEEGAGSGDGGAVTQLQLRERALMDRFVAVAEPMASGVLAAGLRTGSFALLLGLRRAGDADPLLRRLVSRVRAEAEGAFTVGVAPEQTTLAAGAAGLQEADQVARAAVVTEIREQPFYRLSDLRLRGLVALLGDDPRVRTFARAELGPLLAGRPPWGLDLLDLYLRHGGNKSEVARAGHLSRQALYARIHRVEEILGVSLDDAESRTALHLALLWVRLHSPPSRAAGTSGRA